MLYNVREIYLFELRAAKSKYLGLKNNCWIDVPYPVTAAVMGFENVVQAALINQPKFKQPYKYQTFVLVQNEKGTKNWIYSVKRQLRRNTFQTYVEQVLFYQSRL